MKQLSGLDASFLYMETASQFGHVSSLSIYERPDDPDYEPLAVVARTRSSGASTCSSRCAGGSATCRSASTTRSGSRTPTSTSTSTSATPRCRRRGATSRSPSSWRASSAARSTGAGRCGRRYVIEGLPDDRFAILTKVHHATIDGAVGRRAARR